MNRKKVTAHIKREVKIVSTLKAKLLVETDILKSEKIDLLFTSSKMIINSCKTLIVLINITFRVSQQIRCNIQMKQKMIIELYTLLKVSIHLHEITELLNQTLMFQSEYHNATQQLAEKDKVIYAHVIDSDMTFVQIRNDSDESIILEHHTHLRYVTECLEENCYLIKLNAHELADKVFTKIHWGSWVCKALTAISLLSEITEAAFSDVSNNPHTLKINLDIQRIVIFSVISHVNSSLETVLSNSIMMYSEKNVLNCYSEVINCYLNLWADKGCVTKILKLNWMIISLVDRWDPKKVTVKVYSMTEKNCNEIDKTFNKLYEQRWMKFSNELTSFVYLIFVVWRTITKKDDFITHKTRVVVNIQRLNKITMLNSYSLLHQSDIITAVKGCLYIFIMNSVIFFYQWLIVCQDWHKLTVITHQGLKHFKVTVMKFWNSSLYIQCQIDWILQLHCSYA